MSPATLGDASGSGGEDGHAVLSVAEAARRLGVARSRIYQLLAAGALNDTGTQPLRITLGSVERRLHVGPPAGALLAPLSSWAILALGSGPEPCKALVYVAEDRFA